MNSQFEHLLDSSQYQVFLFVSNAVLPVSFVKHPWFVVNNKGDISRWEITRYRRRDNRFVTKDFCKPFLGSEVLPGLKRIYWNAQLVGYIEGKEDSDAHKIAETLFKSEEIYPYKDTYRYTGPNSNTYAQWILNMFPKFNAKLPWNSFGKDFLK